MLPDIRHVIGLAVVFTAAALAGLTVRFGGPAVTGVVAIRLALGICAAAFFFVAAIYFDGSYHGQAIGHGVAGIGLTLVAIGGEGIVVWSGVLLIASGGLVLLQSSFHGGRGPAST